MTELCTKGLRGLGAMWQAEENTEDGGKPSAQLESGELKVPSVGCSGETFWNEDKGQWHCNRQLMTERRPSFL